MEHSKGMKSLGEAIAVELVNDTTDILIDYADIGIDTIFDDEIVKEIPVVKTIAAVYRIGLSIKDRYFAKKLLIFLSEYHKGVLEPEDKEKFYNDMKNISYRNNVIETVIIYLDRYAEQDKALIYANLLIGHIKGKYDWSLFKYFSNCLDSIFLNDIEMLKIFYDNKDEQLSKSSEKINLYTGSLTRLEYLGFISSEVQLQLTFGMTPASIFYKITNIGILFAENAYS